MANVLTDDDQCEIGEEQGGNHAGTGGSQCVMGVLNRGMNSTKMGRSEFGPWKRQYGIFP